MTADHSAEIELFNVEVEMATLLQEMSNEELHSFAELHEDPANDDQIELYIYTCFFIFTRTHSMEHLRQAIGRMEGWIAEVPMDHPDRARRFRILDTMSDWMSQVRVISDDVKSKRMGPMDDIKPAVEVADMAVNSMSEDHSNRANSLNRLSAWINMRIEQTGLMDDINRAIELLDMALNSMPEDHPDRASLLINLAEKLGTQFQRTGSMDDINRAIEVADMAVDSTPVDHPARAGWLNSLGARLGGRFERTGSMDDLNRAVKVADMAVTSTPEGHLDRAGRLSNLGTWLGSRFQRTGSMDDLNRAIKVADMAVTSTPEGHLDRACQLSNIGNLLGSRFERTGSMDDLNRAVEVADMAVTSTPEGHLDRAGRLNNLGIRLGRLFERTGSMDDINRAIEVTDMAVTSMPEDHPDRARQLSNIGNLLGSRFYRTGSMDDLCRAIEVTDMALKSTPEDHPDRGRQLSSLGIWLGTRFKRTRSMDDINRAVEVADMAVDSTPEDHPARARWLNNLSARLGGRFERTGSMDDLNRAVEVADMAVNSMPEDHPDRAVSSYNLGAWLCARFGRTGTIDDLNRAVSVFKEGWHCPHATPYVRVCLARNAASILASRSNWEESSQLLREAVDLLPAVSPRFLKHTDKQDMLAAFAGLASMAAATALNAGKTSDHALQLLELGRGIIAGLLLEMRGDISDLKQQHPDLADEFVSLRDMLDSPVDQNTSLGSTDTMLSWESQASRSRDADQKFGETLTTIRAKPGFHNFLLPPTPDELMAAADPDPIIVVNLSSYRCDAFLVQRTRIKALELPTLTQREVQERIQGLASSSLTAPSYTASLLEWLWDTVSRPVLVALGFNNPPPDSNWPRVWWIPTGVLSQLPLHAAGYQARIHGDSHRPRHVLLCLVDQVIDIWAPTPYSPIRRTSIRPCSPGCHGQNTRITHESSPSVC
jgi:tetratricopeptide (TPR) repeat protein